MIKITQNASGTNYGSADFFIEEHGFEQKGQMMFRITGNQLEVLDPFGGQNSHAYGVLRSLLQFELEQQGQLTK